MAAVTVAGQCRERSPADIAIFGSGAARFAERFVVRTEGEAMLAEALSEGVAETSTKLRTGQGEAEFQVSLWRQRGGDRIRLIAAFAHRQQAADDASPCGLSSARVEQFGAQVHAPLGAIMGFSERMRRAGGMPAEAVALSSDVLAAAWRISRLVDDLVLLAGLQTDRAPLRVTEVDIARLSRRVLRLAEPHATTHGVSLSQAELPGSAGPIVLADETTLWSAIENLLRAAVLSTEKGGEVQLACSEEGGDLVLGITSSGSSRSHRDVAGLLSSASDMSFANGARLERPEGKPFSARLIFPGERRLSSI